MTQHLTLPISEYHRRVQAVQQAMAREGYDLFIVYSDEYRPGNGTYLTNYKPINVIEEAPQMVLVPRDGEPIALMGRLNTFGAREVSWVKDIRPISELTETLRELQARHKVARVGLAGQQLLPVKFYDSIVSVFEHVVRDDELLARLRQRKSEHEIRMLEQSARLAEETICDVVRALRPGVTEVELAAVGEYGARRRGGEIGSAYVIIAGKNTAYPTWRPHPDHKVQDGDYVIIDASPALRGYSADVAITAIVGEGENAQWDTLRTVNGIVHDVIHEDIKPGMTIGRLYDRVHDRVRRAGLEEFFLPWAQGLRAIGHGVGVDVVEWPNLGPESDIQLPPNSVISLKLDLHGIPHGGIRIELMVAIGENSARSLNFTESVPEEIRRFIQPV